MQDTEESQVVGEMQMLILFFHVGLTPYRFTIEIRGPVSNIIQPWAETLRYSLGMCPKFVKNLKGFIDFSYEMAPLGMSFACIIDDSV